jgi:hypothetical protein
MQENMPILKKCLSKILKSMDDSQTFNLHRFGSTFRTLWRKARPYGDESLTQAEEWVNVTLLCRHR